MGNRAYLSVLIPMEALSQAEREYYEAWEKYRKKEMSYEDIRKIADKAFNHLRMYHMYQECPMNEYYSLPHGTVKVIDGVTYAIPDRLCNTLNTDTYLTKKDFVPSDWPKFQEVHRVNEHVFRAPLAEVLDSPVRSWLEKFPPNCLVELDSWELIFND